jgi:hypothetical protein
MDAAYHSGVYSYSISGEIFREQVDDSINKFGELFKRYDNRLSLKGLSIPEKYIEGRSKIIADIEIFHRGNIKNLQAVFRANSTILKRNQACIIEGNVDVGNIGNFKAWDNSFMLIDNVQVVNCPKRAVPTLVRFQRANYLDDLWGGAVYVSLMDHSIKVIPIIAEGEINTIGATTVELNQLASEDIQSRSEVMNCIAGDEGKTIGHFFSDLDREHMIAGLRVLLDDDSIRMAFPKFADFEVKVRDVLFGPFNL